MPSGRSDEFRAAMDELQQLLKNAPKAAGQERIYIHGEKEYEALERNLKEGIPLDPGVAADLDALALELGLLMNVSNISPSSKRS